MPPLLTNRRSRPAVRLGETEEIREIMTLLGDRLSPLPCLTMYYVVCGKHYKTDFLPTGTSRCEPFQRIIMAKWELFRASLPERLASIGGARTDAT